MRGAMQKENKEKTKLTSMDIDLLFGGFLKLLRKNIEIQVKEEHAKEFVGLKKQLNTLSIENVKLKQQLLQLQCRDQKVEEYLGYTLDSIVKD